MRRPWLDGLLLLIAFSFSGIAFNTPPVQAEEKSDKLNTGQDFTRPRSRFEMGERYQNLPGAKNSYATTFRIDKPIILNKNGWLLSLRADTSLISSDVPSSDNPSSDFQWGGGDLTSQLLIIAPQGQKNWTYGFGARVTLPTASQDQQGSGRYQIAPLGGVKMDLNLFSPGSFVFIFLNNSIDVGGRSSRAHVNSLSIQPGLNIGLPGRSFVTISPEIRMDLEHNNHGFIPFDITLGKMLNRSTVVSLEYKTPIYDDKYPLYDHEISAKVALLF